jgi:hypothetical protein
VFVHAHAGETNIDRGCERQERRVQPSPALVKSGDPLFMSQPSQVHPFLQHFDQAWAPRLALRARTFRAMFEYLLRLKPQGHLLVETGCARQADNWEGDGQSTTQFDRFVTDCAGQLYSVDINPESCAFARARIGPRARVFTEDSVPFLRRLAQELMAAQRSIDLLYLDSFDWNAENPVPSAVHHLKELCAVAPVLRSGTLVVVDDSFRMLRGVRTNNQQVALLDDLGISGKAMYVAQYFQQIGVPLAFEGYQCGWIIP